MKKYISVLMAVLVLFINVAVTGLKVQAEDVQEVEKKDIAECTFEGILGKGGNIMILPSQRYTGSEIKPSVTIKDGGYTLVEGVDYSISPYYLADNVNVNVTPWRSSLGDYGRNCPEIVVYGKGNYKGLQPMIFAILSEDQDETEDHFIYEASTSITGLTNGVSIVGYVGTETEVTVPDHIDGKPVYEIGNNAFSYNPVIAKVDISDNVILIGEYAFYSCGSLKSVEISSQLQAIDTCGFAGCVSLQEIYLPETMQTMALNVFYRCTGMQAVHVQAEDVYDVDGVLFLKDLGTKDLYFYPPAKQSETYCIPDGTERIFSGAFSDVENLGNVIIPSSVNYIFSGEHGGFSEMAGAVNIVFKHDASIGSILRKNTFYDLPAGSTVTVKNETMKTVAEAAISSNCAENVVVVIGANTAESLTCLDSSITLSKDEIYQLTWTQIPADTTDNVTWTSSDDEVASVNSINGKIKAVGYGKCTITGTDESGHSVTVDVLVYDECTSHSFKLFGWTGTTQLNGVTECTVEWDGMDDLYAVAQADGYAGAQEVVYESDDEEAVTVVTSQYNPKEAFLYINGIGTAVITAIFDDNGKEIRESVTVHVEKEMDNPTVPEETIIPDNSSEPGDPETLDNPLPSETEQPTEPGQSENPVAKKGTQMIKYTKSYKKAYGSKAFLLNAKITKGNGKLTYISSNKKVADVSDKGKVTIKGTGSCTITVKATATSTYNAKTVKIIINVAPKKNTITSVKAKGNKLTVKWKKDAQATGYQMQCSTDKKFKKSVKTVIINKSKTISKNITRLKKGKIYYVRVRSYKKIKLDAKSKKLYGSWSNVKKSGKIK